MSKEQATRNGEGQTRIVAFVCGSQEEQAKQKAEILEHCERTGVCSPSDSGFFSEWREGEIELKSGGILFITDLSVFLLNREEEEMVPFCIDCDIVVKPIKKEHSEAWSDYLRRRLSTEPVRAGLLESIRRIGQKEANRRDNTKKS